ncbi:RnfH family protein [Marichromatium sp. PS1]|uniref:RnfH family protein n=1 Tax=Marichromatium sp. PS1 TaxID=3138932 RepID=UPI0032E5FFFF
MTDYLQVSVAYVGEQGQMLRAIEVACGTRLEEALHQSGVLERFPEIDLARNKVGVFGKLAKLDQALEDGDRIEIYRPLIADPKAARKRRAAGAG